MDYSTVTSLVVYLSVIIPMMITDAVFVDAERTGAQWLEELAEQNLGTFYLTDFLVEHFDRLIICGMLLDKHPELRAQLFANCTKVVYLSQRQDNWLVQHAQKAAEFLASGFETVPCG